jgi:serine protease
MNRNWSKLLLICSFTFFVPSCGSGQRLVGIQVTPASVVFLSVDPSLVTQLTATGSYAHPPATKNITSQVTWTSAITRVAQVTSSGNVSPNVACGTAVITASLTTNDPTGNVITGTTNVTVDGPASQNCPSGGFTPTLTVVSSGTGTGVVTSAPSGISCGTTCSASFPAGTSVTLTAAPNSGFTFGSWSGCDSTSGPTCTVLLSANRSVGVTFN